LSKHWLLKVLALIFLVGCSRTPSKPPPIAPQEYLIYAAVIERFADSSKYAYVVVKDSTLPLNPEGPDFRFREGVRVYLPPDYRFTPYPWDRIRIMWPEMDTTEYKEVFEQLNGAETGFVLDSIHTRFNLKKPNWRRGLPASSDSGLHEQKRSILFEFSRGAIHTSGDEALLFVQYYCGGLCGAGTWCWCQKTNGVWTIYKALNTWVS